MPWLLALRWKNLNGGYKETRMNATDWAAWVGAFSGVGGLFWTIYTAVTAGPKLEVSAFAGMVKMPSIPANPKYIKITVQNRGSSPTSITNITFHTYGSWLDRVRQKNAIFNGVIDYYEGAPFPRPLEIGRDWVVLLRQDDFEQVLASYGGLWVAVHHSFSKRPIQVKVFQPKVISG